MSIRLTHVANYRDKISLAVIHAGVKGHHLDLADPALASTTMSAMHSILKESGYLGDKDVRAKTLSLRVSLFAVVCAHSL